MRYWVALTASVMSGLFLHRWLRNREIRHRDEPLGEDILLDLQLRSDRNRWFDSHGRSWPLRETI